MIWGCISAKVIGNLAFVKPIMKYKVYLGSLKDNLKPTIYKLGLGCFNRITTPSTLLIPQLLYNVSKQLKKSPQSPDLNPMEHVWDILERRIRQHTLKSKEMLKNVMIEEWWSKITTEETTKSVESMSKRL